MDEEDNIGFDLAIIDADSMIYALAHKYKSVDKCLIHFNTLISSLMDLTDSKEGVVLLKGKDNFRFDCDPEYKGNRKDTIEPDVRERIDRIYAEAADFAIQGHNGEADDYAAFYAADAAANNVSHVVIHIDKDLDCIPGWHLNFKTGAFKHMTHVESYTFVMNQLLTGDGTDNIKGIYGVGYKTAEKKLKPYKPHEMWNVVISTWKEKQGETIWKNNFIKCANCIYLRQHPDDLRVLTFEELEMRLKWKITDTGFPLAQGQKTPSDSSMPSSDQQNASTLAESN
jgi:5'-3' exonuclease